MIIGFGNWVKPGDPAVTVLFADAYDGRMNAPVPGGTNDPNSPDYVPLAEREGISDEPEWLAMIEAAKDGTFIDQYGDWNVFNEKYLDVAWSNMLFKSYSGAWSTNNVSISFDSEGWPYVGAGHRLAAGEAEPDAPRAAADAPRAAADAPRAAADAPRAAASAPATLPLSDAVRPFAPHHPADPDALRRIPA